MMIHHYTRHCLRLSDKRKFTHEFTVDSETLCIVYRKFRGDRLEFLETLNMWNRNGSLNNEYFYTYVAGDSLND